MADAHAHEIARPLAGHDTAGHADHAHHPRLQHHFYSMEQQLEASILGMWIFLVTEIMFFGGLFTAYLIYRTSYPQVWEYASRHHMEFKLGTINTVILLCSSLTVALSVHAIQMGQRKLCAILLLITVLMGMGFLGIKGIEYHNHYLEGTVPGPFWHFNEMELADGTKVPAPHELQLFFYIYFVMPELGVTLSALHAG